MEIHDPNQPRKVLSVFHLAMINVIAVDSLRTLTVGAEYGFALVFFYAVVALIFFIPTVLISAELATAWPTTGGVYIWVREAFGKRWGFLVIWLQWIYNIVWYPTIFAFIAGVLSYLIDPALVSNKMYMLLSVLVMYWGATWVNCRGIQASSAFSALAAIGGTILPMVLIIGLGVHWLMTGHSSQVQFSVDTFFPNLENFKNLAFLTAIAFGLIGMEMSAVHAGDVKHPERNYPRALAYSAFLILMSLVCASLAIAVVIPTKEINLISGLVDAFTLFFKANHWEWFIPVIVLLIALGSLGNAAVWILGPARGLLVASHDSQLPKFLRKTNKKGMPVGILILQGMIFTVLTSVFLLMPTVSGSYWVLTDLTAQLALLFYILFFAAAIRLRYKMPEKVRAFKIPGGHAGMWLVAGLGILFCLFGIGVGFIPPTQIEVGSVFLFEAVLIGGLFIFCGLPLLVLWLKPRHRK